MAWYAKKPPDPRGMRKLSAEKTQKACSVWLDMRRNPQIQEECASFRPKKRKKLALHVLINEICLLKRVINEEGVENDKISK